MPGLGGYGGVLVHHVVVHDRLGPEQREATRAEAVCHGKRYLSSRYQHIIEYKVFRKLSMVAATDLYLYFFSRWPPCYTCIQIIFA